MRKRMFFSCAGFYLPASPHLCRLTAHAADWQVQKLNVPARVTAVDTADGQVHVSAGGLWYQVTVAGGKAGLEIHRRAGKAAIARRRAGGQPDRHRQERHRARLARLADPRYDHGILGDKTEAGSLVIETRDGKRQEIKLDDEAVFEDLKPRIVDLEGNGHDAIVVVKSYLKRGSALAVIAERRGRYQIVAETPPLGAAHRWLDPAGIADFTGDGKLEIALVRQPHVVGALELWSFNGNALRKVAELPDAANHIAGTRAIDMSAVADFDGDGIADLAVPSLDRKSLRLVAFAPAAARDHQPAAAGESGDQYRADAQTARSRRWCSALPTARWWWCSSASAQLADERCCWRAPARGDRTLVQFFAARICATRASRRDWSGSRARRRWC